MEVRKSLPFTIGQDFWEEVVKVVGDSPDDFDGDQEIYLREYKDVANRHANLLRTWLPRARPLANVNDELSQPRKIYQKCTDRRYLLLDFINPRWWSYDESPRINWKQTVSKWNNAHPSDTMSQSVLKATYYRALREARTVHEALQEAIDNKVSYMEILKQASLYESNSEIVWRAAHRLESNR